MDNNEMNRIDTYLDIAIHRFSEYTEFVKNSDRKLAKHFQEILDACKNARQYMNSRKED